MTNSLLPAADNPAVPEQSLTPFGACREFFSLLFPFHLVFADDLHILQIGPSLRKILPQLKEGELLSDCFTLLRPEIPFIASSLSAYCGELFILLDKERGLRLKGQMVPIEQVQGLAFLCSPWLEDATSFEMLGLELKDFSLHDSASDYLFLLHTRDLALKDTQRLVKKLEQANQVKDIIVSNMREGVCLVRKSDAHIAYANQQAECLLNQQPGGLIARAFSELFVSPQAATGALQQTNLECELLPLGGPGFWAELNCSTLNHPVHGPTYLVVFQNISQRKNVERQLVEREQKYRGIFSSTSVGLFETDWSAIKPLLEKSSGLDEAQVDAVLKGQSLRLEHTIAQLRIVNANQAALQIFEAESLALDQLNLPLLFQKEFLAFFIEIIRKFRLGTSTLGRELVTVSCKGKRLVLLIQITLTTADDGGISGIIGVSDLTAHQLLEEQFRQAQKMDAIGRLAGGIAHDFNNLLTVIIGCADFLCHQLKDSDQCEKAELIAGASSRAAHLTGQLLAFTRQQVLNPLTVNLNTIIAEMEKLLQRVLDKQIQVRFNPNFNLWTTTVDRGQFEQILLNLVINARDAIPRQGTITIETANVVEAGDPAQPDSGKIEYVMLQVQDTGIGMDQTTQNRIFEPFFTTKGVGKGTGLGLSTVIGIVEQHNGKIAVSSQLGKGTTFKVYFPRSLATVKAHASTDQQAAPFFPDKQTVLLVEDEDIVRKIAGDVLRRQGLTVLEAVDGRDGLRVFQQHADCIALVITDMVMPGMTGEELGVEISRIKKNTKMIFMSGYTANPEFNQSLALDKQLFLQKPFLPKELLAKVEAALQLDKSVMF
jgi:signal transduction histidine kinase/ActR/RegA family two-component response regulator